MANGRSCTNNVNLSSDHLYEFTCTPCARKDKNSEAVNYCQACAEYFCGTCMAFHNNFPALRAHQDMVIGQEEMKSKGKQKLGALLTDTCEVHGGKIVELYCPVHDQTGCVTCITLDHRACINVDYIPMIATGSGTSAEFTRVKAELEEVKEEMLKQKVSRQQDKARIKKERSEAFATINDFRQRMDAVLDEFEKAAKDELNEKYSQVKKDIHDEIQRCDIIITSAERWLSKLETADENNEPQTFINIKKVKRSLSELNILRNKTSQSEKEVIQFEVDQSIIEDLKESQGFGRLLKSTHLYSVTKSKVYSVRIKEDPATCGKQASCQLPDGRILIIDCSSTKLKRLGSSYQVVDYIVLPAFPISVCCTVPNEAAVVLENHTIQCLNISDKMMLTNSFTLDHAGYGVAFTKGELYISDGCKNLYVYNLSGVRMRVFHTDQSGNELFSSAGSIAVSDNGENIYVTDLNKGLLSLDRRGNVKWTFSCSELENAYGVCCDKDNNVFVCGNWSHNVIQVSPTGSMLGVLLADSDGLKYPTSVLFHRVNSSLLVFMGARDYVKVFDLQ